MCIIAPEPDSIDSPMSDARQARGAAVAGGVLAGVAAVGDSVFEAVVEMGEGDEAAVVVAPAVAITVAVAVAVAVGVGVLLHPASSRRAVIATGAGRRLSTPSR